MSDLTGRDRLPHLRPPLPAVEPLHLALDDVGALLHDLLGFGEDEFDVAWVGHVGVDL